jgi:hypothetical protein
VFLRLGFEYIDNMPRVTNPYTEKVTSQDYTSGGIEYDYSLCAHLLTYENIRASIIA